MEPVILIAEDDADIRRLLRLYLEGEGFRVLEADNGASALALARERTPDMAILDVMMPEMNGFELTRALRRYSNVPILILSARSQDNEACLIVAEQFAVCIKVCFKRYFFCGRRSVFYFDEQYRVKAFSDNCVIQIGNKFFFYNRYSLQRRRCTAHGCVA